MKLSDLLAEADRYARMTMKRHGKLAPVMMAATPEGLILFTLAVLVVTLGGQASGLTAACAWIYLIARVLYVPAYLFGWTPWRSVIWGIGATATLIMILASLF